jgi:hypothetical protein
MRWSPGGAATRRFREIAFARGETIHRAGGDADAL